MKDQTNRWMLAAGALGALLAALLFLWSAAPATHAPAAILRARAPQLQAAPAAAAAAPAPVLPTAAPLRASYIVQAGSAGEAGGAVVRAGGVVTGDLSLIRAVSAELSEDELARLRTVHVARLRVFADAPVSASSVGGTLPETYYPSEVAAQPLHVGGVNGRGVTVAVVDSGIWSQLGPDQSAPGQSGSRVLAQYDVIAASQNPALTQLLGGVTTAVAANNSSINDLYGHGTHVSSIIASSGVATTGNYQGVAPGVNLVSVRVLDANGQGSYSNVIKGIQWVLLQKLRYNIRVMNLSLSAPPSSVYWEDPLNQAVMAAWAAGVVVVAAAGNRGPEPMTVGVPGNVPYVVTVGA
ncbi:MAG TPA: S8 family serine peptidase, partial [Steroidobacteraceae bacterium]|nr:S8 family serine peptidase [Steroidobacteraceae bacterium]